MSFRGAQIPNPGASLLDMNTSQRIAQDSAILTPPDTASKSRYKPISPLDREVHNESREEDSLDPASILARGTSAAQQKSRALASQLRAAHLEPIPLQQLQYRSYKYTISFYHYNTSLLPLPTFKATIARQANGWHHTRTASDPLHKWTVPDGDEIPPGFVEVAYIPNIFQGKGCSVGFRDHEKNEVEFLCFEKPVETLLKEAVNDEGEMLCDLVATQEKDGKGEKGNPEHRAWYESVLLAKEQHVKLKLRWKSRDKDSNKTKENSNSMAETPSGKKLKSAMKKTRQEDPQTLGRKIVLPDRTGPGSGLRVQIEKAEAFGLPSPQSSPL